MMDSRLSTAFHAESWRKSSKSLTNSHCVEVAVTLDAVGVRDTKDRSGGTLVFTPEHWAAFTAALET